MGAVVVAATLSPIVKTCGAGVGVGVDDGGKVGGVGGVSGGKINAGASVTGLRNKK
jgi:hypothetical protein